MKKAMLLLSLTLLMVGCKKNEPKTEDQQVQGIVSKSIAVENNCSIFDTLKDMKQSDQVNWLRANQDEVCATQYDSCREIAHKITEVEFNEAVKNYWGTETPKYTQLEIGDIEGISEQTKYGLFLQAETDTNSNVVLTAVSNFTDTPTCFSIPLFYSIQRLHSLTAKSSLAFTKAKIKDRESIVFMIKGTSFYYDMTTTPQ